MSDSCISGTINTALIIVIDLNYCALITIDANFFPILRRGEGAWGGGRAVTDERGRGKVGRVLIRLNVGRFIIPRLGILERAI